MAGPDRLYRVLGLRGLRFLCRDCGHTGEMSKEEALRAFGEMATPSQVRARLRCTKCGSKRCEAEI